MVLQSHRGFSDTWLKQPQRKTIAGVMAAALRSLADWTGGDCLDAKLGVRHRELESSRPSVCIYDIVLERLKH